MVLVVLADVHHRQVPKRSHRDGFVERAPSSCTVTKETDRYLVGATQFAGKRGSSSRPQPGTDDTIGTQHIAGEIRHVHGSALPCAGTSRLAEQLGHHSVRLGTLGQAMPVAAMRPQDIVIVGKI